jgi:predicted dehydrogenase
LADWDWGIERRDYVRQFANAVLRDEEPGISGRDGRVVQAIVEAIYTSQIENKPITLEAVSR